MARAGFSLVEALVVLSITSLLLVLLVSVSTGGVRAGFHAAARADTLQERLVGADALRTLMRSVRLPGSGQSATPFVGDADGFTAAAVPGRPTACGSGAPMRLALRLERSGGRTRLVCARPGGASAVLLDLGTAPAAFSYALAGRPWAERIESLPPSQRPGSPPAPPVRARLWLRLSAAPSSEVVEAADAPAQSKAAGA